MSRLSSIRSLIVSLPMLLVLSIALAAMAQWVEDGTPVCTATNHQREPVITADGRGGTIVAWKDKRSGTDDIYAQRLDAIGAPQWTAGGLPLTTAAYGDHTPEIISDGAGGAIVAWVHDQSHEMYANRVDSAGMVLWGVDGVALTADVHIQDLVDLAPDGSGGAIFVWEDQRSGLADVYAQRVNAWGIAQWSPGGIPICDAPDGQLDPRIDSDGAGGAVMVWTDARNGSHYEIYAQRVDASGDTLWPANGVALGSIAQTKYNPQLVGDGAGGALVTWSSDNIYAQYVDGTGALPWGATELELCTAADWQGYPRIVSDRAGGAIVAWEDDRNADRDIFAQRFDTTGAVYWAADGVAVCDASGTQRQISIASDGPGSSIIAWGDYRQIGDADVYLQRLSASGASLWQDDGVRISSAAGLQDDPSLATIADGVSVTAWEDARTGYYDIYALLLDSDAQIGLGPEILEVADVPNDQGGLVNVRWGRNTFDRAPKTEITHYSVWRSLTSDQAAAMRAAGAFQVSLAEIDPGFSGIAYRETSLDGATYGWQWLANTPAHYFTEYAYTAATLYDSSGSGPGYHWFLVSAHTSDPFVFYDSAPDSGYSVDNLPPAMPQGLAADIIGGCDLYIHWTPNDEPDLSHYSVYRGADPDFAPEPGNRIATPNQASYVDEQYGYSVEYHYKVSASDISGNESPCALLEPGGTTDVPGAGAPHANALFQNAPNPFGGFTHIAFSIAKAADVRLKVFDAKGRLVRTLVDEALGPNRYVRRWDGLDQNGRHAPSGTYFYRLELPSWSEVKKLTVAR